MQELSHPGGDIFHGGFRNELSASSETFSGSLHMNNDFESPIFTDNDFQSLVHLDFPILQNENNVYPNTVPSENAM
ncbi:hypothetical protein GcM3_163016 [Golovinomyces cichoracearum]|uniref:Uncharacterized protein n=1 Tax=Golovinomyces cichoracearum TaxID=62708 RepID=A0A420HTG4_9PEZI|nr:hypothetical protein GcM3_163016 [Golovinomyces cichoracearum]